MSTPPMVPYTTLPLPNGAPPLPRASRDHLRLKPHEHAHLAQFLTTYVAEQRMTPKALALKIGMSDNYLNAIKNAGNVQRGRAVPSPRLVVLMAFRLAVPLETLLGPPLPPEPPPSQEPEHGIDIPNGLAIHAAIEDILDEWRATRTVLMEMPDTLGGICENLADIAVCLHNGTCQGARDGTAAAPA